MLWEPPGCCGCFDRKTGCLILGGLGLAGSILSIIGLFHSATTIEFSDIVNEVCNDPRFQEVPDCPNLVYKSVVGFVVFHAIIQVIYLVFNSMLIHGVRKEIPCLMVPIMVLHLILLIFSTLLSVVTTILVCIASVGAGFLIGGILGLSIFLGTYFLLVIRAHYLEIRRGTGEIHRALVEDVHVGLHKANFA